MTNNVFKVPSVFLIFDARFLYLNYRQMGQQRVCAV